MRPLSDRRSVFILYGDGDELPDHQHTAELA